MIKIPTSELTDDALLGVIDAFILREGTDYGHQDFTLDEKRDRVKAMLQSGAAEICFYPENEHIDIVLADASAS
ncbi:MAG: YheU family protein [Pseudomonadales bacterium]|jgi:uncharacterized protein YheU (UPF0270 family)|nr:hypothetical protein [Gammaproteobacteria bacterium]MAW44591.1 hypothetical protein [Gammaproteobacteria bacterium]MDP6187583.1 YheU family protein [Pseudomonadales bacterium]RPG30318.1 MAG: YheU family protein [Gammaproteobacteria bacterium TMED243]|tara:strand:- start:538 stop:759 length:222 start_codon:yes stop_codon:yes gene_type:complete